MAQVQEVELIVPQGATFVYAVTYVDPDLNDAPMDLTDHDARLHVRLKIADPTTIYEADSTDVSPDLVITPATGKITLTVPAAVTALWTFKRAFFDLEIEDSAGVVTRLVKGTMLLDLEVTR